MFFSVEKQPNINFPNNFKFGKLFINTDNGWHLKSDNNQQILYKGYTTNENNLDGNFCSFVINADKINLEHSFLRTFPLYYINNQILTNLYPLENKINADKHIVPFDNELNFKFQDKQYNFTMSQQSEQAVIDQIYKLLFSKIENFLKHNRLPLKVFLSGGIDSMLVYSFFKKMSADVEILKYFHMDIDYFLAHNNDIIKNNWAYNQIHHFKEPCVLLSGAPGDEFMLRSPTYGNIYLKTFGSSILEQSNLRKGMQSKYFLKQKNLETYSNQKQDKMIKLITKSPEHTFRYLLNCAINDYQHWHLGNTLTFTPLMDLEIYKLCLSLPFDSAVDQIFDSKISRKLIEMNDPALLQYVSSDKNYNSLQNLWQLINKD